MSSASVSKMKQKISDLALTVYEYDERVDRKTK